MWGVEESGLGMAELLAQVALVSLRNRPGAMFVRSLCRGDSVPLLPCRAFSRHQFQRCAMLISMLCFALAFITAGADGWAWTAALRLQKGWLT